MIYPLQVEVRLEPLDRRLAKQRQLEQPKLHRTRLRQRQLVLGDRDLLLGKLRLDPLKRAFALGEFRPHGVNRHGQPVAELLRVGVDQHRVVCFLHRLTHGLHNVDPAAVGIGVVNLAEVVDEKIEKTGGVGDQFAE